MTYRKGLWLTEHGVWVPSPTVRIYRSIRAHAAFTPVVNAFRFYADGTESGSSPLAAQDTNITVNVDGGDQKVHLRYRIDETGGVSGATTDDYVVQFSHNGGSFVGTSDFSSDAVAADGGSSLTDLAATTNRATNGISDPGAGSFIAGVQKENDSNLNNFQLTASNFTEHVFALSIIATAVNNGDTIDFRVTLNGGTPGMTNNVTPRITIQKTVAVTPWWISRRRRTFNQYVGV